MPSREQLVRGQAHRLTGLDFIHVVEPHVQTRLRVYFVTDLRLIDPAFTPLGRPAAPPFVVSPLDPARIVLRSELEGAPVPKLSEFLPPSWGIDVDSDRLYLELTLEEAGGFGRHRLRIDDTRIDPYFNDIAFDFKVGCDDDRDCRAEAPPDCPSEPLEPANIDLLARDFGSFTEAALAFARQRNPTWTGKTRADPVVTMVEAVAAVADELAYTQDRYAQEAYLDTATQPRSLKDGARFVDYQPGEGRAPHTELMVDVTGAAQSLPSGTRFFAVSDGGHPIAFEVGTSISDVEGRLTPVEHELHGDWNLGRLRPFDWQEERAEAWPCGATEVELLGPIPGIDLWAPPGSSREDRRRLLFEQPRAGEKPLRHLARVRAVLTDPVSESLEHVDPLGGSIYHRVQLESDEALPFETDTQTVRIGANLVPVIAGTLERTLLRCGATRSDDPSWTVATVERAGPLRYPLDEDPTHAGPWARLEAADREEDGLELEPEAPVVHRHTLAQTTTGGLAHSGPESTPEVWVCEVAPLTVLPSLPTRLTPAELEPDPWKHASSLLEALPDEPAFTVEDGSWRPIITFHEDARPWTHVDYASGRGKTLRFGDGRAGRRPPEDALFYVAHRPLEAEAAHVGPDAIRHVRVEGDPGNAPAWVLSAFNPFAVDAEEPESLDDIRRFAPVAWREWLWLAVRAEDFGDQLERLDWVQRAHGRLQWTGSWSTAVATADPIGRLEPSPEQRREMARRLDAVRQVGREVRIRAPKPIALELEVEVCTRPGAYPAHVRAAVRRALVGPLEEGRPFFHADRFSFGTPLRRSALEAAIQSVEGVQSVEALRLAARARRTLSPFTEWSFEVEADEVIQLEVDPIRPGRGRLRVDAL